VIDLELKNSWRDFLEYLIWPETSESQFIDRFNIAGEDETESFSKVMAGIISSGGSTGDSTSEEEDSKNSIRLTKPIARSSSAGSSRWYDRFIITVNSGN